MPLGVWLCWSALGDLWVGFRLRLLLVWVGSGFCCLRGMYNADLRCTLVICLVVVSGDLVVCGVGGLSGSGLVSGLRVLRVLGLSGV